MHPLLSSFALAAEIIFVYMTVWFLVAWIIRRNDIADIAWGLGFMLVSVITYITHDFAFDAGFIVTALVCVWGSRLSYHIFKRNVSKPEDRRYVAWRNAWGSWVVPRAYLQIFMLQGLLMLLVLSPVIVLNTYRVSIGAFGEPWGFVSMMFVIIGVAVWMLGFYFESVGDSQLKKFLSNPDNKGKILNTGLWKFTRHPNYFGEVTEWWGIWIISLSLLGAGLSTGSSFGVFESLIGIIGPLTISFLILKISGIPMLEKTMSENPLFDEYRRVTSVFIPQSPKV